MKKFLFYGFLSIIASMAAMLGMATTASAGPVEFSVGVHGNLTTTNLSCESCPALDVAKAKGLGVELGAMAELPDTPLKAGLVLAYNNGSRRSDVKENGVIVGMLESASLSLTPQVNVRVHERVDLFVRAGVANERAKASDDYGSESSTDRLAFTGGAGVEVALVKHVSAYGEWNFLATDHTFGSGEDATNVSKRSNRASLGLRASF